MPCTREFKVLDTHSKDMLQEHLKSFKCLTHCESVGGHSKSSSNNIWSTMYVVEYGRGGEVSQGGCWKDTAHLFD